MDFSVVVVTHNQHDLLRQCLQSVLRAMEGIAGEVLVVDNASVDATPGVLADEFPTVRVIRNDYNVHYTRAMNQGLRASGGRYVFLLNDDTEMAPDCFRQLIDFMDRHPRCAACGPLLAGRDGLQQISAQKFPTPLREMLRTTGIAWKMRNWRFADSIQCTYPMPMQTQRVDWVCGGAIVVRRCVMEALGGHDEHYLFYRDDPDIGMRMRSAGHEVWYCTEARVIHHHGMSTVKTPRRVRFDLISVRSRRHYHRKFHGPVASFAVEAVYGIKHLATALKCLLLMRGAEAREQFRQIGLLFEACSVPREEREAEEGYRRCPYNGMQPAAPDAVAAS